MPAFDPSATLFSTGAASTAAFSAASAAAATAPLPPSGAPTPIPGLAMLPWMADLSRFDSLSAAELSSEVVSAGVEGASEVEAEGARAFSQAILAAGLSGATLHMLVDLWARDPSTCVTLLLSGHLVPLAPGVLPRLLALIRHAAAWAALGVALDREEAGDLDVGDDEAEDEDVDEEDVEGEVGEEGDGDDDGEFDAYGDE